MDLTQFILTSFHKLLSNNRVYFYKISDQADKIIVWLVGFSISSIVLSISNKNMLDEISPNTSFIIVIFSSITIITGVLYRIFIYIAQNLENQMFLNFEGYIEGYNNESNFPLPREIKDNECIINLISFLEEDFNIEVSVHDNIDESRLSPEQKEEYRSHLIKQYRELSEIHSKHIKSQIEDIKSVLKANFGYSNKKINNIFDSVKSNLNSQRLYWFSLYLSGTLFIISTSVFTSGYIVFLIKYLTSY